MNKTNDRTILVAGATGYLGRFVVAELHQRGFKVRAITRSRARAESLGHWESQSRGLTLGISTTKPIFLSFILRKSTA